MFLIYSEVPSGSNRKNYSFLDSASMLQNNAPCSVVSSRARRKWESGSNHRFDMPVITVVVYERRQVDHITKIFKII